LYDLLSFLKENKLPNFRHFDYKGTRYFLPDGETFTIGEFAFCDTYSKMLLQGENLDAWDQLIATICRPKTKANMKDPNWNGDIRELYNSRICDARLPLFKDLPFRIKSTVLYYSIQLQKEVTEGFEDLFVKPSKEGEEPVQTSGRNFGWMGVIMSLAEQGVFGDFDKTFNVPAKTILLYLLKKHDDLKSLKS
jgi:hypothetical protein